MERETVTIKIGENEVVHKAYATPREVNVLRDAGLMDGDSSPKHEIILIDQLVVSINGVKEKLSDYVLDNFDFTSEYTELISILAKVISKKK